ncbi:hypothetical protein CFIICLFH_2975 [Methylobacterium goesingense]|nr:hypothetical protein CFIICLFH_2975 [Methylobacterium goesingense]
MIGRIALAACFALPAFTAGAAGANEDEQAALCRGDVMRLCLTAVPDRTAIVSCMKVNRASLSAGCRSVFDGGTRGKAATRSADLR